ncbi:MAG TPA: CdaR family protein [Bryobacteraceae bacterium]|nr:CdaR family protein [Bryobacteraceae bacterium]
MTAATLKSLVTHNFSLKVLALCAACGLWFNIASEPELSTIISIPVDYKNSPKDLVISSSPVDSVEVEARGPASRLGAMQEARTAAVIDFSSVHSPGERTFTLGGDQVRTPRGVTLLRVIPEQLRFRFEHQITGKVQVEVVYSGALPAGLTIAGVTVAPPELVVTGPESHVRDAHNARTDPFDLTKVLKDPEQDLATYIGDPELRTASTPRVQVTVRVQGKAGAEQKAR